LFFTGEVSATNSTETDAVTAIQQTTNTSVYNESQNNSNVLSTQSTLAAGAPPTPIKGYWVRSESYYLNSLSITWLRSQGITDLFVLTDRENIEGTLQPFINKFGGYSDIRIHAWVRAFKDSSGNWYAPCDRPDLNDWVIETYKKLAKIPGLDGIHLDYVRYKGDAPVHRDHGHDPTMEVTNFVKRVREEVIDFINPELCLSAALMPPCEDTVKWYGQDYGQLAQYLDFMVPMIYRYSYNGDSNWIAKVTAIAVSKANGNPIVAGLQNYDPDLGYQLLSSTQLQNDINTAIAHGAAGFVVFRYGPAKYVTYTVAKPYKKVRYRKWMKYYKWVKKRIRISKRKYKIIKVRRARWKRVWRTKWLYKHYTYGKWVLT
jgi:hypothetical protein